MNQQPPNKPCAIDQSHLRRARNLARQNGRSVIAELEDLNNDSPAVLVQQLALLFGMTPLDAAGLAQMVPAYDLLPLPLATQWRCLLLREDGGALIGVLADPFDPDMQLWLNCQARGTMLMRLVSSVDLENYFSMQAGSDVFLSTRQPDQINALVLEVASAVLRKAMRR